ncbi:tRNA pseudouridine(55) synthase TruB [Paracoccus sp. MC1862]|uniref:tRNA pseudouridine(55) synthase TruB n=1 Tax=Paracoccus sp. MC1862 TaxID=2760307 RepID=UPI001603F50A|nr:tRNA pseudouridine(55) synthase TruB [Paracoccus sp. MC1862]MBB1497876.1 tRNA pseudouridine(55) synthase TruB [Paracoccus sp. MC1862]QQO44272.1 tRNA pseudouridine(55) synthase TruB [Paracoccus sp. MC1862]
MARKKGRDISGWLLIDKPAGVGSTDVVSRVRWALDAKKAGHAGTLDPDATGLLAVALGEATKTVPWLTEALKAYDFTVTWGAETSTDDASGEVLRRSDARPSAEAIEVALPAFRGEILQVPPAVSAVKVDGARAYDLAREGEAFTLAARPLWVEELMLTEARTDQADLHLVCGKGGYVRAIARDLGRALGCLGHVQGLRRVWSGPFEVADAIPFDRVDRAAQAELDAALLPVQSALDLPEMRATDQGAARLRNGNPGQVLGTVDYGAEVWVSHEGRAVAIGRYMGGEVHPSRVFVQP